jgi:Uma2 family endonuclease
MPITYETFERLALEDDSGHWELACGQLRQKPPMTQEHNESTHALYASLLVQLDPTAYTLRSQDAFLRLGVTATFQPDLFILPQEYRRNRRARGESGLETYAEPMPLVVEVWSPSTGSYDLRTKLPEYQQRGDREIWLIHPYERWLRAWRRQADGSYAETLFSGDAVIGPAALPGVSIALARLFA